jgi:pSer/pThr/pTyr-binding forkhead associated (FHA) protein
MATLAKAIGKSDIGAFRRKYGEAFLLFTGTPAQLKPPIREWQATLDDKGRKVGGAAPQRLSAMLVHPLRSDAEPWSVTVGRVLPNDVVIPDETVSIYHAAFKLGDGDKFLLQDRGSTNGTFVNEARVPPNDEGGAIEIKSSNMVRFGSVVMTFLLAQEVLDLARTLGAVTASELPRVSSLREDELFENIAPSHTGKVPLSDTLLTYFDAVEHVQQKRFKEAKALLRQLLSADPDNRNAQIWLLLAEARELRRGGMRAEAAAKYRAILKLDPDHEEAHRAVGKR